MNTSVTNTTTTNQTLFSATVTHDVPQRLSVGFTPGSGFSFFGVTGPFKVTDQNECRISLGDKKIEFPEAVSLASDNECGTYFELKQGNPNTHTYECQLQGMSFTRENLSQVTLKVRNAKLIVGFNTAETGPAAPVMPGALPTVQAPVAVGVPGAVAPVAAAAPQPPVTPLRGDLPQEIWNNKRLVGTLYSSYQWYVKNPNRPNGGKDQADYDLLYPIFLKEEGLYATLQEKLRAAAAHDKVTGCLPIDPYFSNLNCVVMRAITHNEYKSFAGKPKPVIPKVLTIEHYGIGQLCQSYERFLEQEKEYLTQQARNEYNAAS